MNPKIAIIGYGSMGKEIELLANSKKIEITNVFDINSPLLENSTYNFDVAIDFSVAATVLKNIEILSKMQKNIVIGTTGWLHEIAKIEQICTVNKIGCIWSSNFSLGMQIFFKTLEKTAKLMNNFDFYDVFINEIHHKNKLDSPSGTANRLAKIIIENFSAKNTILAEQINRKILPNELHISSIRGGSIFGNHTVYFDSESDTVELTHKAKNRKGFAEGALLAANWINKKVGFYCFDEILFDKI